MRNDWRGEAAAKRHKHWKFVVPKSLVDYFRVYDPRPPVIIMADLRMATARSLQLVHAKHMLAPLQQTGNDVHIPLVGRILVADFFQVLCH